MSKETYIREKRPICKGGKKDKKTCITGTLSSALSMSKETYIREKRPIYKGQKKEKGQKELYQRNFVECVALEAQQRQSAEFVKRDVYT